MDTLGGTGFSLCLEFLDFFAQAEACATQDICAKVAQALDGAEKLSGRTAPYGRGSVCRCKKLVPILSRDHRERFSAFFSTVFSLCYQTNEALSS